MEKNKGDRPIGPDPEKIKAIIDVLRDYPEGVWLRLLAERANLAESTVALYVDKFLEFFVESGGIKRPSGGYLGVRIIRFKPGKENTSLNNVMEYWELKRKIKG